MKILLTISLNLSIFTLTSALGASQLPARAIYKVTLPQDPHPKLVDSVEIAVDVAAGQANLRWYQLTCTKVSGESFTIWFLADANPFTADTQKAISFNRYILQESGQSPIEYIEQRSGKVLLPLFDFVEELLPRAAADTDELLFEKGSFLGHPLVREQFLKPQPVTPPKNITKLVLNPNMLIGTSRNFRDDGTGRKEEPDDDDYKYVPFTKQDYDEMIAAGVNYFWSNREQIKWIYRRPVFYGILPRENVEATFPQELYRSNFTGVVMYLDEPAIHLTRSYPKKVSPTQAIDMIHQHILEKHKGSGEHYSSLSYRTLLTKAGIQLGSLKLTEPDIPIWETIICTSYYQLEANPYGIIHESRWQIGSKLRDWTGDAMLHKLNAGFGTSIPIEPKNLFLCYYSQLRGAARAFNARWGMAIYGQAEPELRLPSMKLAYDLGASFIWFWTSDHDHHVPYDEQLALASAITDYAKSDPRPPLNELLRLAKTAISLPYGYTLPSLYDLTMFGSREAFPLDRKNRLGITYKEVLTPAIKEIERCLKDNIPYDVVIAGKDFDPADYDEVVWIKEDGTVRISENRSPSIERYRKSRDKPPEARAR